MTTKTRQVTKAQAMKVLADVRRKYGMKASDKYGPELWIDDPFGWGASKYSIAWEGGPFEWTVGYSLENADSVDGVWTEPDNTWLLSIYPNF